MVREFTEDMAREVLGRSMELQTMADLSIDDISFDHAQVRDPETGKRKMLSLHYIDGIEDDGQRISILMGFLESARLLEGDDLEGFMDDHLIRPEERKIFSELAQVQGKFLRAKQKAQSESPPDDESMERLMLPVHRRKGLAVTNEQLRGEGLILDEDDKSVTLDRVALEALAGMGHKEARRYLEEEGKGLGM